MIGGGRRKKTRNWRGNNRTKEIRVLKEEEKNEININQNLDIIQKKKKQTTGKMNTKERRSVFIKKKCSHSFRPKGKERVENRQKGKKGEEQEGGKSAEKERKVGK